MARSAKTIAPVALGALGVVFGDIGTSPLYAFSQCFTQHNPPTPSNVLGILSLIIWALIVVVCVKYIAFLMRADYDGEGGILALLAQVAGKPKTDPMPIALGAVALVALFGATALYGDGMITPAISVSRAVPYPKFALGSEGAAINCECLPARNRRPDLLLIGTL